MGHAVERGLTVHQQHFIRRTAGGRGTRREDVPRRSRARTSLGGIGRRRGDASCQAGSGWAATRSPSGGSDVRRGWAPAAPGESDEAVHLFIVRIGLPYLSCKSVEGSRARRSRSGSAPGSVRWRGARMSGATSRACPHEAGIPARVRRRRRRTRAEEPDSTRGPSEARAVGLPWSQRGRGPPGPPGAPAAHCSCTCPSQV